MHKEIENKRNVEEEEKKLSSKQQSRQIRGIRTNRGENVTPPLSLLVVEGERYNGKTNLDLATLRNTTMEDRIESQTARKINFFASVLFDVLRSLFNLCCACVRACSCFCKTKRKKRDAFLKFLDRTIF